VTVAAMSAILALAVLVASPEAPEGPPRVGDRVPDFALFDTEDRLISSAAMAEPVLVLNFWGFWCDTWVKELGQLRELALLREGLGFRLLAISVDGRWTDELGLVCGEGGLPFPVLLDTHGTLRGPLGIRRVPTVLVLDRERRIRYVHEAYPGNAEVLKAIRRAASRPPL